MKVTLNTWKARDHKTSNDVKKWLESVCLNRAETNNIQWILAGCFRKCNKIFVTSYAAKTL